PLVAPTTSAERGGASKAGDQGARSPATSRVPIIRMAINETPIAQGRRFGLRSPLLARKGRKSSSAPISAGSPRMTQSSILGGTSARAAKIQRKYQSGRGYASRFVGSGGASNFGALTITASATITSSTTRPRTTSRQRASGQKGTPSRWRS